MVSFAVQKTLIKFHSFTFVFIFGTPGDGSKKILLQFMSKTVTLTFSRSFILSSLIFSSIIYFELISVGGDNVLISTFYM